MLGTIMLFSAGALLVLMLALWVVSLPLRDVSVADPGWGLGFAIIAWIAFAVGAGNHERQLLLAVLVSVWSLRLSGYLHFRWLSAGREDPRYTRMRQRYGGPRFPLTSLGVVFLLQAAFIWVVSLPIQGSAPQLDRLGALDWAGVGVWAVGFLFEAVGDEQLRRFKADPANKGRVMDRGLWRYTRHPNYFGDFTVWWGIYLIALSAGGPWWMIIGPLVNSTLMISGTGKKMLENIMRNRPGYADYVARTSGFFPLPPRRASR